MLRIENSGYEDPTVILAKDALKTSNTLLTDVLNVQKTNPYTQILKSEDNWRDEIHIGGRDSIQAMTHWVFDLDKQEAAKRLIQVFEQHGWSLYSYGYQKQSSAMNSLIAVLKKPEYQKDLETCNMLIWFEEEEKAQAKFEKTFNEKAGHEGRKELMAKQEARITVNNDLESLISLRNGLYSFKKNDEVFANLYKDIEGSYHSCT